VDRTLRRSPSPPATGRRRALRCGAALLGAAWLHPLRAQPGRDADVLVLGAGLAGLNAAHHLEAAGLRVRVLEAAARVGGRIHTLDELPGKPETGGTQIGAAYARTVAATQRLGLALETNARSPLLRDERMVLHVHGRRTTLAEWAMAADNPFAGSADAVRALPPDRALGRLIGPTPLKTVSAWRDPAHAALDAPADAALRERGLNDAALRLLDVSNAYGDTLGETSLLNLYYTQANIAEIIKMPGPVQNVVGGNQRLPEAMARALKGDVLTSRRVVAITSTAQGTEVRCADGAVHQARFVVNALPLPAMRAIAFDPPLPPLLAEAVQRAAYARVTQLHLEVLAPFWEADNSAPYLWSDGPLERVFPQDRRGDSKPATLTVWVNGAGARRWDSLDEAAASTLLNEALTRIWPSARGAVRLARRVAWQTNPLAGGAWINWAPGQITRYAGALGQPAGRVHFAGEHTGTGIRGIEAAMESGERAAHEVVARA
jgi:monoamine oxidase